MNKSLVLLALGALISFGCSSYSKKDAPKNDYVMSGAAAERYPAAECELPGNWKECKNARKNTWADQYLLAENGDLFAYKAGKNGKKPAKCQVTDNVDDIKLSQHRDDAAAIYFTRKNDLYFLKFAGDTNSTQCIKQEKKVLLENVEKFTVMSGKSAIVNVGLTRNGKLVAWDEKFPVYQEEGVQSFSMNECFAEKGKPFSSFAMFTIDFNGFVTAVKGGTDASTYVPSKQQQKRYGSLQEFKQEQRIDCN